MQQIMISFQQIRFFNHKIPIMDEHYSKDSVNLPLSLPDRMHSYKSFVGFFYTSEFMPTNFFENVGPHILLKTPAANFKWIMLQGMFRNHSSNMLYCSIALCKTWSVSEMNDRWCIKAGIMLNRLQVIDSTYTLNVFSSPIHSVTMSEKYKLLLKGLHNRKNRTLAIEMNAKILSCLSAEVYKTRNWEVDDQRQNNVIGTGGNNAVGSHIWRVGWNGYLATRIIQKESNENNHVYVPEVCWDLMGTHTTARNWNHVVGLRTSRTSSETVLNFERSLK